ncbi:response regulator transcription factor [Dichotomicrobium thermohalophilum]|uniref:LuxR family two component transcriptional regulator n=1 Tax=Dichotomicrobium thermohalophilum TaxID=933063 RepID=A0A397PGS8_9HYPH|nr:LuxR C-terminal-related transcriptional regulator [Dichotomicrobium thermohalophilum]RIA47693.1 LuxR family two component transcriptional regulator [Dichotomicrobium thermohalophilum]
MISYTTVGIFIYNDDVRANIVNELSSSRFALRSYSQAKEFVNALNSSQIDCALADAFFQNGKGADILDKLLKGVCECPVLLVDTVMHAGVTLNATGFGVAGVIRPPLTRNNLLQAIELALANGRGQERVGSSERFAKEEALQGLTCREREVLALLVSGYRNKMIAHELGISQRTVEVHRARLMRKLNVKSFADLIRLAMENRSAS